MANSKFTQAIKYLSIIILLFLTALSYHPSYSQFVTEADSVNPLNKYIYAMDVIVFALHFNFKEWMQEGFIKKYLIYNTIIALFGILVLLIWNTSSYLSEARNCFMAFVFLAIGYNSKLSDKQLLYLLLIYGLTVAVCTFLQITVNLGGFTLSAIYLQYGKNTLGVMTSCSCIALTYYAMSTNTKFHKYIAFTLALILLAFTITIRARAAFLSAFLILGYIGYKKIRSLNGGATKIIAVIIILTILALSLSLFSSTFASIGNYIYESFTLNQGTDITSDRLRRNDFAIDMISQHFFFGNLEVGLEYDWVHNYFLRQFSSYGLFMGLPLLALYLYLIIYIAKNTIKRPLTLKTMGYVIFLLPLVISLEEPTFPYSPGTGVVLPFILLGYSTFYSRQDIQI